MPIPVYIPVTYYSNAIATEFYDTNNDIAYSKILLQPMWSFHGEALAVYKSIKSIPMHN